MSLFVRPTAALVAAALAVANLAGWPAAPALAAPVAPVPITDVNGDGKADIVSIFQASLTDLAAYHRRHDGTDGNFGPGYVYPPGSVSVVYGGSGEVDTVTQEQLGDSVGRFHFNGDEDEWLANSWSGTFGDVSLVADMNRDGFSDIVIGNPGDAQGAGVVWVLWGSARGVSGEQAVRLLSGARAGDLVGGSLAYVAKPRPMLVVGDKTQDQGRLSVYPIEADGTLGAARLMDGLPPSDEGYAHTLAASDDLLVVGASDATVSGAIFAGAVVIVRFLPEGRWVSRTVTQNTPGVPGKAEAYDGFGGAVSILNGYLAVGVGGEAIGPVEYSGMVQPFRVTGSGDVIKLAVLPSITPRKLGWPKRSTHRESLGDSVQVYRVCDGRYGVLMQAGDSLGKGVAVRAPFVRSSRCKPKVLTTKGWGWEYMSVLRTTTGGTKAETALLNTKPYRLTYAKHGKATVTKSWKASQHPEFNFLVQPAG